MGRAPCCDKANVKKGPWSPEEDVQLKEYMEKHGTGGNWIALPQKAGLKRCGKSCRLRWLNYLRPNIKHGEFTDDEDRIICSLFASIGSRWSIIASQLPGRTDNDIKNYWNTKLKKKLMRMGPSIPHQKKPNSLSSNLQNYYSIASPYSSSLQTHISSSPYEYQCNNNNINYYSTASFTSLISSNPCVGPMHGDYNQVRDSNNSNLIMFGSEASCSSSDGSNYFSNGVDENQKMLIINGSDANGCFSENPLDYSIEEIKQLISTNNVSSNNLSFFVDEIKTEEKLMYY
ncbi:hypothetical protein RD792_011972 [Penstemon davidsonii]|uniref:Uncharacterized protein n=1 Tax=Penstemon davidsonii TaxID=160366 RepID=A0ABR0CX69_9LAMI|nr:hypothetical protein RD792_011972 [Penstemon davidsonii]